MRQFLLVFTLFMSGLGIKPASCADNLLAVDVISHKEDAKVKDTAPAADKPAPDKNVKLSLVPDEAARTSPVQENVDFNSEMARIKGYHDLIHARMKEVEVAKLDLQKSDLLLKRKEMEKRIVEIDKSLPAGTKDEVSARPFNQGVNPPPVDSADIKIFMLVISDKLKEGILTLKGVRYGFREGDCIASKLTVSNISSGGVTFKQPDGQALKLNFIP